MASKQTDIVRARIDPKTKAAATRVLKRMGLTPSDAFRLLMRRTAMDKTLPFAPFIPNAETVKAMRDAERGIGLVTVKNAAAAMAYLDADD